MSDASASLVAESPTRLGNGSGVVEATERLYRTLFAAALGFSVGAAAWGLVIAPFNSYNHHHARSVALGAGLLLVSAGALASRRRLYEELRCRPALLAVPVIIALAVLWADGGWRSSFYLASYAAVALAAVVANIRIAMVCGAVLAAGYVLGLAVNGYSWHELKVLNDADSVVANTGGYLIAAFFFAAPVAWLGGYVARILQVIAPRGAVVSADAPGQGAAADRLTNELSVKEIQVVQLLTEGMTNPEIGDRLCLSPRTVQSHLATAMRKTGTKTRTELAVLAVREGLVPRRDDDLEPG
jgi:DNA-binding CsgD family transcriptional regulator